MKFLEIALAGALVAASAGIAEAKQKYTAPDRSAPTAVETNVTTGRSVSEQPDRYNGDQRQTYPLAPARGPFQVY